MATTVEGYIATLGPIFVGNALIPDLKEQYDLEVGTVFKRAIRNKAIALLVLHSLTLNNRDTAGLGAPGALKREKEDRLEREFLTDFTLIKDYPDLAQTQYGVQYIRLMKSCIIAPRNRFTE